MQHLQIWRAIDALAERKGLSASGLARAAGLDPTTFNKSKREGPDGKQRWPSTESLSRALTATDTSFDEFAAFLAGSRATEGLSRAPPATAASFDEFAALKSGSPATAGRAIPVVGLARAGADGFFDD